MVQVYRVTLLGLHPFKPAHAPMSPGSGLGAVRGGVQWLHAYSHSDGKTRPPATACPNWILPFDIVGPQSSPGQLVPRSSDLGRMRRVLPQPPQCLQHLAAPSIPRQGRGCHHVHPIFQQVVPEQDPRLLMVLYLAANRAEVGDRLTSICLGGGAPSSWVSHTSHVKVWACQSSLRRSRACGWKVMWMSATMLCALRRRYSSRV